MKSKIFLPFVPCGGSKPKNRQKFIKEVQAFLVENEFTKFYIKSPNIKMMIQFHYKSAEQTKDIDNSLKGLLDGMKGYLFFDDRQIKDIHARIVAPSNKIGIEVRIFGIKPPQ